MIQIKKSFLKKKSADPSKRKAALKAPAFIKSILIISNSESKSLKRRVEELFPNASVYHLFPREIKEDRTVGFYYSVHPSDFNLTANLKNDKLENLKKMQTELLLDLSFGSEELNYFVSHCNSSLKAGDMSSTKADLYDLLVQFGTTEIQNVEYIYKHLNTLTKNASS